MFFYCSVATTRFVQPSADPASPQAEETYKNHARSSLRALEIGGGCPGIRLGAPALLITRGGDPSRQCEFNWSFRNPLEFGRSAEFAAKVLLLDSLRRAANAVTQDGTDSIP
jgi:hypothetical protein